MTAKRLGAVVVAIALVGVAFVVRAGRDDAGSSDPSADTTATVTSRDRAIVCIPELRAVCDALADDGRTVRTEAAPTTLGALAALNDVDEAPIWVTVQPFPGMVDAQRSAAGEAPLGLAVTRVASTPLAVALADQDRLAALDATCGDIDVWACLGEHAGDRWSDLGGVASWGTVRPAVGDVTGSATALVSFAAAASGYFGTTDLNRTTWESDTGFLSWLRPLARTVTASDLSAGSPLATMVTRPSALDAAATTDAELTALGARAERFATNYPRSAMSLDAVLAAPDADRGEGLVEAAAEALRAQGWSDPSDYVGPSASTSLALRDLWEATT